MKARSKLCHAAAFVLVGWYLMVPPASYPKDGSFFIRADLPIRHWAQLDSFDTADKCEAALKQLSRDDVPIMAAKARSGRCIASDDPRLKEK